MHPQITMEDKNDPVRKSIDDLLAEDQQSNSTPALSGGGLPAFQVTDPLDYDGEKDIAQNKAKKLMNSLLKFYLSQELIQKNEYITLKAKIDVMTMSNLMFQMRTAEHAIVTLLRSIDAGEASPRMFEVLGGLQKTMLDIMKHQTLHMMAAEENMKKLKRDIDIYGDSIDITPKDTKPQIATVNRGTRNLMRDIQSEINGEEIEETDFDSENQDEL
jgi:cell division GTPase FtsZ